MRILLSVLAMFFFNSVFAQFQQNDTTFLERCWIYPDTGYHAIYFEKNKQSKFYSYLADFSLDNWDSTELLKPLRLNGHHVKSEAFKTFPRKWIMLHRYQGKYVVYSPSERGTEFKLNISDSIVIFDFMEKSIERTMSLKRKGNVFTIKSKSWHAKKLTVTNVYMIDTKNQIAVVEMFFSNGFSFYTLMIHIEKMKEYPFIVNYCVTDRTEEVKFDKTNYKKLIRQ
jgi:hypothetical protein